MVRVARTPVAPETLPETPRRMMRVSRPGRDMVKTDQQMKMIENHLQLIAIAHEKIAYLQERIRPDIEKEQAEIARLKDVLEAELKASKLPGYTNGQWEARWVTPPGRSSREIDADKVYKKLALADFMKVIKVQVTPLKTFMSEREIDQVSTTIPAVPGEPHFTVQPVAPAKKGK